MLNYMTELEAAKCRIWQTLHKNYLKKIEQKFLDEKRSTVIFICQVTSTNRNK